MIYVIEAFDHAGVEGHGDYHGLVLPGDPFQQVHDLLAPGGVQSGRGFVGQD